MAWKSGNRTWTVTVKDPDDASQTADVTLKQLTFGEERSLVPAVSIDEAGGTIQSGELQLKRMEMSIEAWTFPFDVTPANIRELDDRVGSQILDEILAGPPATKAEEKLPPTSGANEHGNVENVPVST